MEAFEARLPWTFGGLAAVIVVLVLVVVPSGPEEQLQQLLADKRYPEAMALLEGDTVGAIRTERGWADAIDAAINLGAIDTLRSLIDKALINWPDAEWPKDRQSQVIAALGSFDERLAWAETEFARTPTMDTFQYLVGAYQSQGLTVLEGDILRRAMALNLAKPTHIERLAYIEANSGNVDRAILLLKQVVEHEPPAGPQARLSLFSLMVENGQLAEGVDLALRTGLDLTSSSSRGAYVFSVKATARESLLRHLSALEATAR